MTEDDPGLTGRGDTGEYQPPNPEVQLSELTPTQAPPVGGSGEARPDDIAPTIETGDGSEGSQ